MERIAVFAGSFCPFTKGHEDIVQQALPIFDKIIIAIGHNINKKDTFTVEQRMQWIQNLYADCPKVEVVAYTGLTVDFCRKVNARYLIRGVRNGQDFATEQTMAEINRKLNPDVETVLFLASQQWLIVSSSLVRELWSLGADYSPFLSYQLPEYQQ
jgi:pantetheine-phosphate adenylyltransferase